MAFDASSITPAQRYERMTEIVSEFERLADIEKPTSADEADFNRLRSEFSALEHATKLDQMRDGLRDGSIRRIPAVPGGSGHDGDGRGSARGRALDALTTYERSSDHLTRGMLDAIAHSIENARDGDKIAEWALVSGNEHYRSAFQKLMRDPLSGSHEFTEREREAFQRAQQLTRSMNLTDGNGGYLVPFQLDPSVLLSNTGTSNANLRAAFRVVQCTGDVWNGVSSAGVTASWDAEEAEVSDDAPTFTQPSIPVHKGAAFVPISIEALEDSNAEGEIAMMLADSKTRLEATSFITGSGSGQPKGLVTAAVAASKTITSATTDTFAVADVYALKAALPARWRARAAWLANETTWDKTRQFATGTGPQSAFWADLGQGTPPQLLGRSVYESSEVDGSLTASAENYVVAYGDLHQYVIADRVGLRVEFIPHLFGSNRRPTGQRGFYAHWRTGGDLVVADAVRLLNVT